MSLPLTVLLMALATYALRLAGFVLPTRRLTPFWTSWLRYVPVAVFAALIATSAPGSDARDSAARVLALGLGAVLVLRRVPLGAAALLALAPYVVWRVVVP